MAFQQDSQPTKHDQLGPITLPSPFHLEGTLGTRYGVSHHEWFTREMAQRRRLLEVASLTLLSAETPLHLPTGLGKITGDRKRNLGLFVQATPRLNEETTHTPFVARVSGKGESYSWPGFMELSGKLLRL